MTDERRIALSIAGIFAAGAAATIGLGLVLLGVCIVLAVLGIEALAAGVRGWLAGEDA